MVLLSSDEVCNALFCVILNITALNWINVVRKTKLIVLDKKKFAGKAPSLVGRVAPSSCTTYI